MFLGVSKGLYLGILQYLCLFDAPDQQARLQLVVTKPMCRAVQSANKAAVHMMQSALFYGIKYYFFYQHKQTVYYITG